MIQPSKRLTELPEYLFSRINELKKIAYEKKLDVIDMGMGNPDIKTDDAIIDWMIDTVKNHPKTTRYPSSHGMPKLRKEISNWMKKRFNVDIDPDNECCVLIGSKEGIFNLFHAFLEEGDYVILTTPSYPAHFNSVILNGGRIYELEINEKNNYIPDLTKIPDNTLKKVKFFVLSYPNNPTGATLPDKKFFEEVVRFAKKYNIAVIHDNAYSEITFDGYVAPSFLEVDGAIDVGVEFHTFSKTYSMAGFRLGWVCGNSYIINALRKFKSYVDYGAPLFIQLAGYKALKEYERIVKEVKKIYQQRRDTFIKKVSKFWEIKKTLGSMYLWAKIPIDMPSLEFCEKLLLETGIVFSPGSSFGKAGEGYVRIALVTRESRYHDLAIRLKKFLKIHSTLIS
ncbi:MAG: aminotransferase class I/II-fold pyridoxal phosphate-dependent enzyme [bacterium]|nr:aminotransferase class I/II-fold pyridoxal phosphate-dependent enzyme [bacterium]